MKRVRSDAKINNNNNNNNDSKTIQTEKSQRADVAERQQNQENSNTTPPYGSQTYWEQRYDKQFGSLGVNRHGRTSTSSPATTTTIQKSDNSKKDDIDTLPYHSWYFTYDELRPLLLPLLLGGREDSRIILNQIICNVTDEVNDTMDGNETECLLTETEHSYDHTLKNDPYDIMDQCTGSQQQGTSSEDIPNEKDVALNDEENGCDTDADTVVENEDEDENDDTKPDRDGLAINGPVSILEIGCGDCPLGGALAMELNQLQKTTGMNATNIVARIVCTDYSQIVVNMMQKQYNSRNDPENDSNCDCDCDCDDAVVNGNTKQSKPNENETQSRLDHVPLSFDAVDARKLPYDNNTFALILEKGTLDAMLSDTTNGAKNCIAIVAESARVLTFGGCILLVSHLNAHTANGMCWLEEVVFSGLKQGTNHSKDVQWEIEVHGHDQDEEAEMEAADNGASETSDREIGENSSVAHNSAGPAVYIIHKKKRDLANDKVEDPGDLVTTDQKDDDTTTIPVLFYTY